MRITTLHQEYKHDFYVVEVFTESGQAFLGDSALVENVEDALLWKDRPDTQTVEEFIRKIGRAVPQYQIRKVERISVYRFAD